MSAFATGATRAEVEKREQKREWRRDPDSEGPVGDPAEAAVSAHWRPPYQTGFPREKPAVGGFTRTGDFPNGPGRMYGGAQMHSLELVNRPLQRQLRSLNVALRGGSSDRAREHARNAVALVNEATDLNLTCDDLLLTLAEGAREGRKGAEILDRLLERGVHRRLLSRGSLVVGDAGRHLHAAAGGSAPRGAGPARDGRPGELDDPRWGELLAGDDRR